MVGYRNQRYRDFGWASARLDDILNLVPARLTAVLATAASGRGPGAVRRWWQDRRLHSSPNAGLVEAAFAQALGLKLGGSASYSGVVIERPSVGEEFEPPALPDIERAVRLSEAVGCLSLAIGLAFLGLASLIAPARRAP
jgi:adenosylcobinamide-phosphate synthase